MFSRFSGTDETGVSRLAINVRQLLFFDNWPILPKILFISFFSVGLTLAATFVFFIPRIEDTIIQEKKTGIRNVVEVAHGVLLHYYDLQRSGALDEARAKDGAIREIKALRYGDTQYFWINDIHPTMIMHPTVPDMDGTDLGGFKDPNGVYLFKEFVKVAQGKGSGFVAYLWPKPGDKKPVAKVSFVKAFEPWGWVIGSGIYLDDVQNDMTELRLISGGGALLFAGSTLCLAFWVGLGITRRLTKVITGLKQVASGTGNVDLSKRIAITSIDEIGVLSLEFNTLMESIGTLTRFKKIIEEDDALEDVYSRLWYVFAEELGLECARIYEVDVVANRMAAVYPVNDKAEDQACNADIFDNSNLCKAKRTAHEISSLDCPRICKQFLAAERLHHICVPMTIGNGTLGVVQFVLDGAIDAARRKVVKENIFKATQFINEALPVIESRRLTATLRESALTDPLTGLRNRRFLQECADNLCKGARRRGRSLALLMCDLDFFKQVNDIYGHDAGDEILKQTSVVLRQSVREADLVFRFGGEEFLIVLVDVEPDSAIAVAEKVRQRIETHKFALSDGSLVQKTISIGVAEYPGDTDTYWRVLKFSDVALYHAKETGRNRVCRFTMDLWKDEQY